ncbi:hypothetical protein PTSG_05267 [Salpingoeca rosetta]|uniref:Protein root UVB sensitive/RUS domain-containing protein n=1 Tax=Salpingoeca rosetta (strain ATCC 50818 / BSB-021) TaxID=946362 RepID=F2U9Y4_SALR5|nr:uncharacterized protein PTSG_05267 [Salpingoeca rosetta]EGD73559.1 hypothetical protein PTSG_05267 [Salpingoeca rosetta]|eukprot:XP_004993841.1 hypothetical protein PTSG_05267 [Salpingoeca rosetta]
MQRSGRLASAVVVLRQYLPGKHVVRVQPRAAAARDGGGLSGKAGDAGGGQYKGRQREDGWNRASTAVVHYVLLERPVTGRDASAAEGATKTTTMKMPSRLALMLSSLTSQPLRTRLEHVFLPRDYRASVSPKFLDYCKWQFVHMTTMTASGVLSMQSLLYAVGVGAGSVPLAAAINWILKDGLGQLGGMLYGSIFGTRFDDDPKRQRFNAVLSLQVSGIVDIITPLFPHHFLLLASVSNFGKNVSYLASSATRAQMNLSFTRTSNLGDVTAKMTSQSIAASVFGTGLGILVSKVTGTEAALLMAAYVPLSLVSIGGNYYSSKFVSLKTFNVQRAEILARHYFTTKVCTPYVAMQGGLDDAQAPLEAIPPPPVVAEAEGIVTAARVYRTPLHVGPNIATLPWQQL